MCKTTPVNTKAREERLQSAADWAEAYEADLKTVRGWAKRKWYDYPGLLWFLDKLGAGSFIAWCNLSQAALLDINGRNVVEFVMSDHGITLDMFLKMNAGSIIQRFPREFPERKIR